jgi:hypothetical protein
VKQQPAYKIWEQEALANDELSGASARKTTDKTNAFDYKVIRRRYAELRALIDASDVEGLCYYLNEGINGNIGGMGAPKLYTQAKHPTKDLTRDYTYAIVEALNFLAGVPDNSLSKKGQTRPFPACQPGLWTHFPDAQRRIATPHYIRLERWRHGRCPDRAP